MIDRHVPPSVLSFTGRISLLILMGLTTLSTVVAQESEAGEPDSTANKIETVDAALAKSEAERLLPASSLMYLQIAPFDHWVNHPLRSHIFESKPFQQLWDSPQVLNARTALVAGEWAMGMKLETLIKRLTAGGVYAAIDPDTQGIALLMRTRDEKWLQRTIAKFLEYARNNAANKEGGGPIRSGDYKGIRGYKFQDAGFAQLGPWLLVTNKNELAKGVVDRYVDGSTTSLADATWRVSDIHGPTRIPYEQNQSSVVSIATVEFDLASARKLFSSNDLFRKQAKDFGAELLLGGVLQLMQDAPSAAIDLRLEPDAVSTNISFPSDMKWFEDSREHYVGPGGKGKSLPLIAVDDSIASLSTYRNLSEMWLRAGDLFDQQVNDQLAQADNTLTTLFSGKDFGTDILGAIEPEIRMVATLQTWESGQPHPSLKLPALAMVSQLKEPRKMQKEMKRIFQSFIGFLNVVGAMEGQPQLDLMSETSENSSLFWGEYVFDADRKYENGLPIQFNFSPSLAFVGDHMILSSSSQLAQKLMLQPDRIASDRASNSTNATPLHTEFILHAETVQHAIEANRDALIAQNMLEKGHSRSEAIKEIESLMGILDLLDQFKLDMSFNERSEIKLRVSYRK